MSVPTEFIAEPDIVVLDLRARTGPEAIRALHQRLSVATDAIVDPPRFLRELLDRAVVGSLCIAADVALPHARTPGVSRPVLAVGRSDHAIAFDAEHPAVRMVFVIGTPQDAVTEYLRLAAAIARFMRNGLRRAALFAAQTEAEFRSAFSGGAAVPQ